ncbi:MAG: alpha/beta hydrolase [Alphaproteobacteria bacterium]|nr:alpha/beta hydrolase [Alphaproteobacteria bacterium]
MSFDNLPVQPKMGPVAEAYAAEILERSRAVAHTTRVVLDVPYGADPWQRIDIYLPDQPNLIDLPVLVFLHGGGWEMGHKEWMGFMAPCFTDLPAIFVSVGYRMIPEVHFPAPLDDTIAALAWVHANIETHGGNPDRIYIGGHSAGGHLSALATLRRDLCAAAGLPADVLKACFLVSAVAKFEVGELEARNKRLFLHPEDAVEASPLTHVAGNRVPFHIVWGEHDLSYVMSTSPLLADALRAEGAHVEAEQYPGQDHFQPSLDGGERGSAWVQAVRRWMGG